MAWKGAASILTLRSLCGGCGRQASPAINVTEVYVLCCVGELLTAEVVENEAGLRAGVARGGELLVRAGATIELGEELEIATDCAIVGQPGGAAPPVLRRKGGDDGYLILSREGNVLELVGLRLEGGLGEYDASVWVRGGRLAARDCEVTGGTGVSVTGGCQAELHGVTIQCCTRYGVYAAFTAKVALRSCTLRENGTDCLKRRGGKIVRQEE
eukprot:COSAG01_NODE_8789_length_2658_cov_3.373974_2_plen_213_part_00